jgi:hypothetical protein
LKAIKISPSTAAGSFVFSIITLKKESAANGNMGQFRTPIFVIGEDEENVRYL